MVACSRFDGGVGDEISADVDSRICPKLPKPDYCIFFSFQGFCAMYKVGGLQKHDGFSGMMGMIVGIVGSYKVYQKSLK